MTQTSFPAASHNQLKKWAKLLQNKYRAEEGLFLAEGVKVVEELLKSDWQVEAILVLPEKSAYREKLSLPDHTPVYDLSHSEFKKLSQDKEPEGILAIVKHRELPAIHSLGENPAGHLLIAHEISNPQNLGALIRTARWFGFAGIVLGKNCVDWTHPKAIRASMGTVFHLPLWPEADLSAILPEIMKKYQIIGSDVRRGIAPHPTPAAALLLGSESHGLPESLLKLTSERWRIPGETPTESLSLPQAAAIMMYEMTK